MPVLKLWVSVCVCACIRSAIHKEKAISFYEIIIGNTLKYQLKYAMIVRINVNALLVYITFFAMQKYQFEWMWFENFSNCCHHGSLLTYSFSPIPFPSIFLSSFSLSLSIFWLLVFAYSKMLGKIYQGMHICSCSNYMYVCYVCVSLSIYIEYSIKFMQVVWFV